MFHYEAEAFSGLSRDRFLKALEAEGIPASGGYSPLNREPYLEATLQSKAFKRVYPAERLQAWRESNQCPANDQLCRQAVWFTQNMLLGERREMEQITQAISRIRLFGADIART
jgi:hypothetical protein